MDAVSIFWAPLTGRVREEGKSTRGGLIQISSLNQEMLKRKKERKKEKYQGRNEKEKSNNFVEKKCLEIGEAG